MRWDEWKAANHQLLAHWQRSGITRIPIATASNPTLAHEWLGQNANDIFESDATVPVDSRLASVPASTAPVTQQSTQRQQPTTPSPSTSLAPSAPTPPARVATSIAPIAPSQPGQWLTPRLPDVERKGALEITQAEVVACRKCTDIVCRRQQTVFGVGPLNARLVMFGEAPGADEDRCGEPFVGAAGQLLNKILVATGLERQQVYIMNSLKCRPPNNRTPTESEIENCRPFFEAQLEAIQPEYIICWGAVAVRAVLKSTESVGRLRGRFHSFRGAKVLVTYHPSYLLRTPEAKKLTWEDMKLLMRDLAESH